MWSTLKIAIAGVVLALVTGAIGLGGGYWKGRSDANASAAKAARVAKAEAAQTQRTAEDALRATLRDREDALTKEKTRAENADRLYHDAVRAGRVRVSIPVTAGSCTAASAVAGQRAETRAELDPAVAVDLDRIANDGDAAIRDLNLVIDLYEDARRKLKEVQDGRR